MEQRKTIPIQAFGRVAAPCDIGYTYGDCNKIYECAIYGDRVLCCASKHFCDILNITSERKAEVMGLINSNKFLAKFKHGFNRHPIKIDGAYGNIHKLATLTEAWIWFLFTNYGEMYTMRYITKQIFLNISEEEKKRLNL